jgi:hypothetical protein
MILFIFSFASFREERQGRKNTPAYMLLIVQISGLYPNNSTEVAVIITVAGVDHNTIADNHLNYNFFNHIE